VDASEGTVLGLIDNFFLTRNGAKRGTRRQRAFAEKDSRRWLSGAESASALVEAGAACVTVIEDREGDIYECFAFKPAPVEKLVRAAQDRRLATAPVLLPRLMNGMKQAGWRWNIPAAPGRKARQAELSVRFRAKSRSCGNQRAARSLAICPNPITVTLVIGREINPAKGEAPAAVGSLITTHQVNDIAECARIASASTACAWTM